MATINLYNHTTLRFMNGSNSASDTYKVMLLSSSASFDGSHTTLAQVTNTGVYEVSGYGWTAGGEALTSVSISTVTTNDATFDAADITVAVSGGSLGPFSAYVIYNATDSGSPPVAFVTLTSPQTITSGNSLSIVWDAAGIVSFTVS